MSVRVSAPPFINRLCLYVQLPSLVIMPHPGPIVPLSASWCGSIPTASCSVPTTAAADDAIGEEEEEEEAEKAESAPAPFPTLVPAPVVERSMRRRLCVMSCSAARRNEAARRICIFSWTWDVKNPDHTFETRGMRGMRGTRGSRGSRGTRGTRETRGTKGSRMVNIGVTCYSSIISVIDSAVDCVIPCVSGRVFLGSIEATTHCQTLPDALP